MSDTTVEEIQVDIDEAKETIDVMKSLDRLMQNPDFKKIIKQGYFVDESARLVGLKAAPQMQAPERQDAMIKAIDGIGSLQQHFNMIWVMGNQAQSMLENADIALEEMALEGDI